MLAFPAMLKPVVKVVEDPLATVEWRATRWNHWFRFEGWDWHGGGIQLGGGVPTNAPHAAAASTLFKPLTS